MLPKWLCGHSLNCLKSVRRRNGRSQPGSWNEVAPCESRQLLAGTVNVTFSGGTLTITAVDDLSPAGVLGGLNDQELLLQGGVAGTVQILALDGETINGGTVFSNVVNLKLDMKQGEDFVDLSGVRITGALTYLGGEGDSALNFTSGVQEFGSITVTNGDGNDEVEIDGSDVTVAGAVTITTGTGDALLNLGDGANDDVSFGSLKVTAVEQNLDINVRGRSFTVTGATQINSTGDLIDFIINPTVDVNLGTVNVTGTATAIRVDTDEQANVVMGNLTVTSASGDSIVRLSGNYGNLNFTFGTGEDFIELDDVTAQNVTIKTGNGESLIAFDRRLTVNGAVAITQGNGDLDMISFNNPLVQMGITGNFTVTHGTGDLVVVLQTIAGISIGGDWKVTSGTGSRRIVVESGSGVTVGKSTTFNLGEGEDEIRIGTASSVDSFKAFTVDAGNGEFDLDFNGATTTIDGALSLKASGGGASFEVDNILSTKQATLNFSAAPGSAAQVAIDSTWTVDGNLIITTNQGGDDITFGGALTVTGTTTFNTGSGADEVFIEDGNFTGKVTINTGAGADSLEVIRSTFNADFVSTFSSGDDEVELDDLVCRGQFNMTTGAGQDSVVMETLNTGTKSRFEKAVSINLEGGNDSLTIGRAADPNDFAEFLAAVTLNGGAGVDIAIFKNAALGGARFNSFAVAPSILQFEATV